MRFSTLASLLTACAASAQLLVNFDESPIGHISEHVVAEAVAGSACGKRKVQPRLPDGDLHQGAAVAARDNNAAAALSLLLGRRQLYCDPGYSYCANFGRCCPTTDLCCSYGYCLQPETVCCPSGPCRSGELCCGAVNCSPIGGDCCRDGSHCEPGNHCYFDSLRGPVCCTDQQCTAHVENGVTTTAERTTSMRTYTITSTQYYYWTITWYYYYYYWTYSIQIQASVVTSTRSTETTTYSVRTTDAAAASEYFSSLSSTLSLPTPAAATTLADLAGKTSYVSGANGPSQTNEAPAPTITHGENVGGGGGSGNSAGGSTTSSSTANSGGGGSDSGNGDGGGSGAAALWSGLDHPTTAFLIFGLSVGILAAIL